VRGAERDRVALRLWLSALCFPAGVFLAWRAGRLAPGIGVGMTVCLTGLAILTSVAWPGELARKLTLGAGSANLLALLGLMGLEVRQRRPDLQVGLVLGLLAALHLVVGGGLALVAWLRPETGSALAVGLAALVILEIALLSAALAAPVRAGTT